MFRTKPKSELLCKGNFKMDNMKSKLELRLEAARIATKLPGTTIDNFHERVYRISLYLQGDAELPEQAIVYTSPNGIPSSEAEAIYLQTNGEKVD